MRFSSFLVAALSSAGFAVATISKNGIIQNGAFDCECVCGHVDWLHAVLQHIAHPYLPQTMLTVGTLAPTERVWSEGVLTSRSLTDRHLLFSGMTLTVPITIPSKLIIRFTSVGIGTTSTSWMARSHLILA